MTIRWEQPVVTLPRVHRHWLIFKTSKFSQVLNSKWVELHTNDKLLCIWLLQYQKVSPKFDSHSKLQYYGWAFPGYLNIRLVICILHKSMLDNLLIHNQQALSLHRRNLRTISFSCLLIQEYYTSKPPFCPQQQAPLCLCTC
jgi:hypothetical protein